MLQIVIPAGERWNEATLEFMNSTKEQKLSLEHSLVSLSKWESKWCKPFLTKEDKTYEETIDYIRCMTLTQNVNPDVYLYVTGENIQDVNAYIAAPMTATTIKHLQKDSGQKEQVTAELVYYWMFSYGIPIECQKWHLNKLLMLIDVFNVKNSPPKKMSQREIMSRNAALNAARRKKLNSKG